MKEAEQPFLFCLYVCFSHNTDDRRYPLHNYEHKRLLETVAKLDEVPTDSLTFSVWIRADAHLKFLRENACANELVIYASGEYTFVRSVVVPNATASPEQVRQCRYTMSKQFCWGSPFLCSFQVFPPS